MTTIATTTRYARNGYVDHSRNGNQTQPQDRPATTVDVLAALKYQTPEVQDAIIAWCAAQTVAPSIATLYARIGHERKNHPVQVGALISA